MTQGRFASIVEKPARKSWPSVPHTTKSNATRVKRSVYQPNTLDRPHYQRAAIPKTPAPSSRNPMVEETPRAQVEVEADSVRRKEKNRRKSRLVVKRACRNVPRDTGNE